MTSASAERPCPVCGGDHKCAVGDGGLIICGRESGEAEGFVCLGAATGDPQFTLYREAGRPRRPAKAPPCPTPSRRPDYWPWSVAELAKLLRPALRTELASRLGLPEASLDVIPGIGYGVEYAKLGDEYVENGFWTFPECDAGGVPIGILRRWRDGAKRMEQGSRRGLCIPVGWRSGHGPVFLVEGPSDVLAMAAAGLAAVGRPSNCGGADHLTVLLRDLPADRAIVVVGENDRKENGDWPGRTGAEGVAKKLAKALGRPVFVAYPPAGAKDVRGWLTDPARGETPWAERGRQLSQGMEATATTVPPPAGPPAGGGRDDDPTDAERGRRFVDEHLDRVRYVEDWGHWCVYDGVRWVRDAHGLRVQQLVIEYGRGLRTTPGGPPEADAGGGKDHGSDPAKFWLCMRHINSLLAAARSDPRVHVPVGAAVFDARPHLLTVPNGTIDLRTGDLQPHRPDDYLTALCPTPYDPGAACPRYERFLAEVSPGTPAVAQYLRDLSGYCITGETGEQSFALFVGEGANGKTVLLQAWAHVLGPDLTYFAPPELLVDGGADRHPTERASLVGKRLVISAETDEDGVLNEPRIKSMTGGDEVTARFCFGDFFSFPPTHKLIVATNYRPRVRGTDGGIWRRVRLVDFPRRFWTEADRLADPTGAFRPEDRADPALSEALRNEAVGILATMVRAAVEYYRRGCVAVPGAVMAAVAEYRRDEDVIGQFFAERVRETPAPALPAAKLYQHFQEWCRAQGYGERFLIRPRKFGQAAQKKFRSVKASVMKYAARVLTDFECECPAAWEDGRIGSVFPGGSPIPPPAAGPAPFIVVPPPVPECGTEALEALKRAMAGPTDPPPAP